MSYIFLQRQGLVSGIHEATLALGFAMGSLAGGLFAWLAESLADLLPTMLIQRSPYLLAVAFSSVLLVLQTWMYRARREEIHGKRGFLR